MSNFIENCSSDKEFLQIYNTFLQYTSIEHNGFGALLRTSKFKQL